MSRSTGVVASYSSKHGYGFITDSETGDNIFVHQNDLNMDGFRHLKQGEEVEYDVEQSEKGLKAISVDLVSERRERKPKTYDRGDRSDHREKSIPRGNFVSMTEHAKVKSDLRRLEKAFDRLLEVLGNSEDPILDENELDSIKNGRELTKN